MKRSLSLILTLLMVMSAFTVCTMTASADAEIVQDGLVSWFDGNDYEGTTWTDKKGDNDIVDCVDGTFTDGAYVLDKAQQLLPNALYDVIRGEEFTIEMNLGAFENYPDTGYTTWLCNNSGTTAEKVSLYIQLNKGTSDTFKAKTSGIASPARPAFNDATATLQDATLAVTFKAGGATCVYVNGELMSSATSPAENANAQVGSSPKFILGNAGVNNCSNTAFEGLRFYNRALTEDEVKNNAEVDNAAPAPSGDVEISIIPYAAGMENWENSDNKGDEAAVTQILICPKFEDGSKVTELYEKKDLDWTITLAGDNGSSKTITLKQSSQYDGGSWGIIRFEPCLAEGDNKFVPEVGVAYTVSISVNAGDKTYVGTSEEGVFSIDVEPIVPGGTDPEPTPEVPEGPVEFVIDIYGTGMENWSDQTQILVCPKDEAGNKIADLYATDIEWTFTIKGSDGSEKTVVLVQSSQYDGGTWGIVRFQPCVEEKDNRFVPEVGVNYTISATVTANGVDYVGTSADGAFSIGVEPIVPVDPQPPVTGDATVYAIVFAVVALMGMGVVVTKKVRA